MNRPSPLLRLYTALACVFLLAPIAVVFLSSLTAANYVSFPPAGLSLRWYRAVFQSDEFVDSLLISLEVAAVVAVLATVLGLLSAVALTRFPFAARDVVNALFLSPLAIPGIVLGAAILQFYAATGQASSVMALVLAHLVIATPYVIRLAAASLIGFDHRLELAAQNLGATPLVAFRRITAPILLPAILGGAAFAFIVSFEDVNLALFLASPKSTTLPVRIFTYLSQESSPIISAAGSVLSILILAMAVVLDRLIGWRAALAK